MGVEGVNTGGTGRAQQGGGARKGVVVVVVKAMGAMGHGSGVWACSRGGCAKQQIHHACR